MSSITLVPIPIQVPGVTLTANKFHYGVTLLGSTDGINAVFTLPNSWKYVYNLGITIRVMVNGALQSPSAFTATELGGLGTGYNAVTFNTPPASSTTITADFVAV